ncbi:ead/Ea22-like family protein [Klebsiella michiganensis]|uniref:ead/Ea22-like family protein n=1 Tax=Klebsiella michiganensis TaxID=1134687 RepID=UPI003D96BA2F
MQIKTNRRCSMTTDITELAHRMRTAAEKAGIEQWVNNRGEVNTADYEVDGGMYIDHICDCEIVGTESPRAEFIALANPANVLALVEALEKAQQRIAELEDAEQKLCVANVTLDARAELAERRLAEMESRTVTVKLPDYRNTYKGTFADEVEHQVRRALDLFSADAGIKWEAE